MHMVATGNPCIGNVHCQYSMNNCTDPLNDWTIGRDFGTERRGFRSLLSTFAVTYERPKLDVRSENIQLKGLLIQSRSVIHESGT